MPVNLSIRNLDDEVAKRLRIRAAEHGRSTEAEVREILTESVRTHRRAAFIEAAARLRAQTAGRYHTPSEILLREIRDEE